MTKMSRQRTLELALDYVTNDRNVDNGDPEDNFSNIAYLMNWWIKQRYGATIELTPTDIAMFSMFIKIARLTETIHKEDNWIDIAGYAACGAETAGIEREQYAPSEEEKAFQAAFVSEYDVGDEIKRLIEDGV